MTYTLIDSVTLGSSAASVTFSAIPQDYGDLVFRFTGKSSGTTSPYFKLNGGGTSSYHVWMEGSGSATSSSASLQGDIKLVNAYSSWLTSSKISTAKLEIFDYTATDKHKSMLSRVDASNVVTAAAAIRWQSLSAVTSIEMFVLYGVTFPAGSTFQLFGISKAL